MDVQNLPLDQVVTPDQFEAWAKGQVAFRIRAWLSRRMSDGFLAPVSNREGMPFVMGAEGSVYSSNAEECIELYNVMYEALQGGESTAPVKVKEKEVVEEAPKETPKKGSAVSKLKAAKEAREKEKAQEEFNPTEEEALGTQEVKEGPSAGAIELRGNIEQQMVELKARLDKHEERLTEVERKQLEYDKKLFAAYSKLLEALK